MDAGPEEEEQGYGNGRLFAEGGRKSSLWGFGYGHHDLCYVAQTKLYVNWVLSEFCSLQHTIFWQISREDRSTIHLVAAAWSWSSQYQYVLYKRVQGTVQGCTRSRVN